MSCSTRNLPIFRWEFCGRTGKKSFIAHCLKTKPISGFLKLSPPQALLLCWVLSVQITVHGMSVLCRCAWAGISPVHLAFEPGKQSLELGLALQVWTCYMVLSIKTGCGFVCFFFSWELGSPVWKIHLTWRDGSDRKGEPKSVNAPSCDYSPQVRIASDTEGCLTLLVIRIFLFYPQSWNKPLGNLQLISTFGFVFVFFLLIFLSLGFFQPFFTESCSEGWVDFF